MIVHKQHSAEYIPFYKSLSKIDSESQIYALNNSVFRYHSGNPSNLLEKYAHMLQNVIAFERETEGISDPSKISERLKASLKRFVPLKDASLLFFDDSHLLLSPLHLNGSSDLAAAMNNFLKQGIINLIFDNGKPTIVPEFNSYNSEGAKLCYLIFPISEENKRKGILVILTSLTKSTLSEQDEEFVKLLLNLSLAKIEKITVKEKLNSTYEELQTYQAKLSNDFRLSAIGELTEGIAEDIISPLQVILSRIDMFDTEDVFKDKRIEIKSQINKISSVISRLIKFANINHKNVKIRPCNINELLKEYYGLVKSTLESMNLECVLDFENNVPPILTHPNYIYQILTNVIGLIKTERKQSEGLIFQTRYKNDNILVKIITSAKLKSDNLQGKSIKKSADLNLRIVKNLMSKHEGNFKIDANESMGSTLIMEFPLKRRFRE